MSEVGDAIEEVRNELAGATSEFMPDLCDLWAVPEGFGQSLVEPELIASDIPCRVYLPSTGNRGVLGGMQQTSSSQIQLPWIEATLAVTSRYQIRVHARGKTPEMIFENPETHLDSLGPFMIVSATRSQIEFSRDTISQPFQRVVPA